MVNKFTAIVRQNTRSDLLAVFDEVCAKCALVLVVSATTRFCSSPVVEQEGTQ